MNSKHDIIKDQIFQYCMMLMQTEGLTITDLDFIMQAVQLEVQKSKYRQLNVELIKLQKENKEEENGDTK